MEDTICLCICVDVVESNVPRSGRLRRRSCKRHHLPGQSPPSRRSPPLHTASHHLCTRLCVANDTASRTSSPLLRFSTLPLRGRMDGWTQMTSSSAGTLSRRCGALCPGGAAGLCLGGRPHSTMSKRMCRRSRESGHPLPGHRFNIVECGHPGREADALTRLRHPRCSRLRRRRQADGVLARADWCPGVADIRNADLCTCQDFVQSSFPPAFA
jgi:hypothetical protein